MPDLFNKYAQFSATDFALDDDFIQWVLVPDEDRKVYWENVISVYPDQKENIEAARKIILSFKNTVDKSPDTIRDRIWENVIRETQTHPARVIKFSYRRLWAAAAIALFVGFGTWFLLKNNNEPQKALTVKEPAHDIAPGGNKAILTLADGSTIVLDSTNNGAISKQGTVTVIKLNDGEISYQPSSRNNQSATADRPITYNTITTPRGGQYQLILADGTKVWLNAESSLRYPTAFVGNERKVTLTGEGYFEVAHDASKPFKVDVNGKEEVEVLGTHFNINAYSDEPGVKTTLLQGSVRVNAGGLSIRIEPGEQTVLQTSNYKLQTVNDVDVAEVTAWKDGKFIFNRMSVEAVLRMLSRWYNVDFEIKGAISKHFGGSISRDVPLSKVIEMIELTGGMNIRLDGKKLIVSQNN